MVTINAKCDKCHQKIDYWLNKDKTTIVFACNCDDYEEEHDI